VKIRTPAKINLFLSVGRRNADGLHELLSLMQAVSLFDEVSFEPAEELSLEVQPIGAVPDGDENLVLRGARALAAMQGVEAGARIVLEKRIPVAAGLAGGSADAAAALIGLNELWGLGVSRKALQRIGAGVGSDVPFCLQGATAVVGGTGSDLSAVPCLRPVWWVLATPDLSLSTAAVYAEFDRLGGGSTDDPYEVADALARADLDRLAESLRNDLQPAALSLAPEIARAGDALREAGALAVSLSGSGPTWLGLATDEARAREIAGRAAASVARVEVVHSITHGPRIESPD